MGIEPTRSLFPDPSPILKTGAVTRLHALPKMIIFVPVMMRVMLTHQEKNCVMADAVFGAGLIISSFPNRLPARQQPSATRHDSTNGELQWPIIHRIRSLKHGVDPILNRPNDFPGISKGWPGLRKCGSLRYGMEMRAFERRMATSRLAETR